MPQISLSLDRTEKELVFGLLDYLKTDVPYNSKYKREFLFNLFSESDRDLSRTLLFPFVIVDGHYLDFEFVQCQIIDVYDFVYSPTSLCEFLNYLGALNIRGNFCTYNQVGKWKLLNYHNYFPISSLQKRNYKNQMASAFSNGLADDVKELLKSICIKKPRKSNSNWG